MTWSMLARDPNAGEFGVAVASKFLAVGALCTHGHGQYGVLATQALLNPLHTGRGLRLLADGYSADQALAAILVADDGRNDRQLHVLDAAGRIAQHTGTACMAWCGSVKATDVSVAGNRLAGPAVVERTREVFLEQAGKPLPERILAAMEAGEAAGGDKLGRQSASLRIWRGEEYAILDLRTDDHPEPFAELRRLYGLAHEHLIPYTAFFATRANPSGTTDPAALDRLYRKRER